MGQLRLFRARLTADQAELILADSNALPDMGITAIQAAHHADG